MFRKLTIIFLGVVFLLAACNPRLVSETPAVPTSVPTLAPEAPTVAPTATEPAILAPEHNLVDGCVADGQFDETIDYFPEKATLTHTEGFSVEYHNHYKVVTVKTPWPGATEPLRYVLVQCGTPAPRGFVAEEIIAIPVKRIITTSSTYLPFLDELDLLDRLVGLDDATYVNNPKVLKMAEEGKLTMIGYGSAVNVEKTLELAPDLVMTYSSGVPDYDTHPVLIKAGVKVVLNAEWLDTTPLGRAEWGKFIAVFFNKEADAEALFTETVKQYNDLVMLAASVTEKPGVFTGTDYQGTWYVPGGNNYSAVLLKDAGADYLWADDPSTGSLPLAFEAVFEKAKEADFWLNIGFFYTLDDLKAADARYADFKAFQNGNVWNNDAKVSAAGGNDFYESAVAHPEIVLKDLIKIFHPDLLPEHTLVYYRQVK